MVYNAISLCRVSVIAFNSLIAFNIFEFGHPTTRYVHPYEALKQPRDAYLCLSIPEAPQKFLSSCHGWYRDRRGLGNMLNGTVLEDFELLEAMISEGLMGMLISHKEVCAYDVDDVAKITSYDSEESDWIQKVFSWVKNWQDRNF